MSEDEAEKFEITDYDLDNEFSSFKNRKKFTKNEQIYGIWADEDSGEEGPSRRAAFKSVKKPKNYTAPIGFVAGGVQQSGKKQDKKKAGSDDDSGGEIRRDRAGFKMSSSDESEDEQRSSFKDDQSFETGEIAGLRRKRIPLDTSLMQKGVGGWEKHTKGIGAKLLLQMGYEPGKGLGKELQGINAPIVAKVRKGRGAVGAYGPEEAAKVAELKLEGDRKVKVTEKLSRWRKEDDDANKKVRYVYKTIEEVIEQGKGSSSVKVDSTLSKVKVIDMTGPEQRVLSGYHAISRQQRPAAEWEARKDLKFSNFSLPELQHNLNLLVDLCEQDIVSNDRKYKHASDRIVSLQYETSNLEKICQLEEQEISKLEALLSAIEELTSGQERSTLGLEQIASKLKRLLDAYPSEYRTYDLPELATTLATPLIKEALSMWQPLERPEEPVPMMRAWRCLVENEQVSAASTMSNPEAWGKLLWHSWMPCIKTCVGNWNSRQPEPLLTLLEIWKPLVPPWIAQYWLESLILPRITLHVHEWDPLSDTVPIHSWIHPWLPLLSTHLQTIVFPTIRQSLSQALTAWHPSDRSARLMILPWVNVFTKGEMNAFLIRNILPKLQQTLDELIINPQHQVLDEHWKWIMDWMDLMPLPSVASLFSKHFFPKWLQVLSVWLNHCPNYDQVTAWYMGWKAVFPENVIKQTEIKEQFRQALDLINRSAGTNNTPGAMESVSYLKNLDRDAQSSTAAQTASARFQSMSEAVRMGAQAAVSGFKALFAKRCEEKDIVFVPVPNKTYEGKQVYRCGSVQVYLDRNVVFVSTNGGTTWQPQSMATALMMAEK